MTQSISQELDQIVDRCLEHICSEDQDLVAQLARTAYAIGQCEALDGLAKRTGKNFDTETTDEFGTAQFIPGPFGQPEKFSVEVL